MWNSIKIIADNNRLNRDEFKAFAMKNIEKYRLKVSPAVDKNVVISDEDILVNNWFVNELVWDFKQTCDEYVFQLESSYGMPKLTVFSSNYDSALAIAEVYAEQNGYYVHVSESGDPNV